jgi:enterochelin esterase-like enzyme
MLCLTGACRQSEPAHPYQDITHYSKVFGRDKYYRLYLPAGYRENKTTKFPVIYFFHGWGGRYKSDDNAKLAYDSLQKLVDKYQVLLVMWDGNVDENEPRPYNVGNHNDVRYQTQMKDYFPELVHHIDSAYRTLPDKQHRGIIGFSMGGFMSYFLSGKYPDMIGAAVGMTGSPEFFVGYPNRHVLYPLRYTLENLREVKLRFHNSTADELTYLNSEVKDGAAWDGQVSFDYWQFVGGHMVDLAGETKVFDKAMAFVTQAFKDPVRPVSGWSHYDLYNDFDIYGYRVKSTMEQPGFTYLKHVKPEGFGITTMKWVPDGPPRAEAQVQITTPGLYPANTSLHIVKLQTATKKVTEEDMQTDGEGRLHLSLDGNEYEFGISPAMAPAKSTGNDIIAVGYELKNNQQMLRPGDNALKLLLFNRGSRITKGDVNISLSTTDSSTQITPHQLKVSSDGRVHTSGTFNLRCMMKPPENAAPPFVRLRVTAVADGITGESEFVIPVMFDVPQLQDVVIDDNRKVNDSTQARGEGNGDGTINAGERIVLYADGRPLKLYTDSPHVVRSEEEQFDVMVPARWPDGFTLASTVKIADDCPDGTSIEFLANYETKEFMPIRRVVHWGKVSVKVSRRK